MEIVAEYSYFAIIWSWEKTIPFEEYIPLGVRGKLSDNISLRCKHILRNKTTDFYHQMQNLFINSIFNTHALHNGSGI